MHFVGANKSTFVAKIDMDTDSSANKEKLQVVKSDDSCTVDFIEIVPLTRDTDGFCTTECVSGDWSAEVKQENLAIVKQKPDDVCWALSATYSVYLSRMNLYSYTDY